MQHIKDKALKAKEAALKLSYIGTNEKNHALYGIAEALRKNTDYIIKENAKDLEAGAAKGMTKALLDRLSLSAGAYRRYG